MALSMEGQEQELLPSQQQGIQQLPKERKPQLTTVKPAVIKREYRKRREVLKSLCKLMGREGSKSCLPMAGAAIE